MSLLYLCYNIIYIRKETKHMIALIVAYSNNKVIGLNGKMPWNLPGDLKRYKELTMGNAIVMGRKTYESIGRPLEGRLNIVISKTNNYSADNLITVCSLSEAVKQAGTKDIFISGGNRVYSEALPYCEKLFVTQIDVDIKGDTFFPTFNESIYDISEDGYFDNEQYPYRFLTYTKK